MSAGTRRGTIKIYEVEDLLDDVYLKNITIHGDKIIDIGFITQENDTLQCSIGMEAYFCVYSLKELKQIYKINIGSFPSQMLVLQNKFVVFSTK